MSSTINDSQFFGSILLFLVTIISYFVAKKLVLPFFRKIAGKTKTEWDDFILKRNLPQAIVNLVPAIVIYYGSTFLPFYREGIERLAFTYIIFQSANVIIKAMWVFHYIYSKKNSNSKYSFTGLAQTLQMIVIILAVIVGISSILGKSPVVFLSSLGAVAAIFTLAFRETILSLMSYFLIQLNDMFREDDWIEIPKLSVDGDIISLGLHTVKVRNWDKTISTLPTNSLINTPVKNWRGMLESGGRRIKRCILIDQDSIKFCSTNLLERLEKVAVLTEYIKQTNKEILEHNKSITHPNNINNRQFTNVGLYRNYILYYLKRHPNIHQTMTVLVRQLAADPSRGLPIEIYCFTNDINWNNYERIQADLFDHLLAILKEFELVSFQRSSSTFLRAVSSN